MKCCELEAYFDWFCSFVYCIFSFCWNFGHIVYVQFLTDWMTDWLYKWLTDWLIDWLHASLLICSVFFHPWLHTNLRHPYFGISLFELFSTIPFIQQSAFRARSSQSISNYNWKYTRHAKCRLLKSDRDKLYHENYVNYDNLCSPKIG